MLSEFCQLCHSHYQADGVVISKCDRCGRAICMNCYCPYLDGKPNPCGDEIVCEECVPYRESEV